MDCYNVSNLLEDICISEYRHVLFEACLGIEKILGNVQKSFDTLPFNKWSLIPLSMSVDWVQRLVCSQENKAHGINHSNGATLETRP